MIEDLIPMTKKTALMLVIDTNNLDELLDQMRQEVLIQNNDGDLSTEKSRKYILSIADKVSSSKILLDHALEDMAKEYRRKINLIDKSRKSLDDFLDALRDEIKQPVIEWEQAEEEKIKAHKQNAVDRIQQENQIEEENSKLQSMQKNQSI